jgi:protein TonB
MSKLDLFNKEWLDVVFAKKNKSYGAYELRNRNGANTTKALLLASSVFIFIFLIPNIGNLIKGQMPEEEIVK